MSTKFVYGHSVATDVVYRLHCMLSCSLGGVGHKNLGDVDIQICVVLVYTHQIGYNVSTMESVGILLYPSQLLYF